MTHADYSSQQLGAARHSFVSPRAEQTEETPTHSFGRSKPQPALVTSDMGDRAIPTPCPVQIPVPQVIESQNGLDFTLKLIQFQPPYHGQGHFLLDQVTSL